MIYKSQCHNSFTNNVKGKNICNMCKRECNVNKFTLPDLTHRLSFNSN